MRSAVRDHHLGADNAGQKLSPVPAQRAQKTNQGRVHFICTPWIPICLSLDSQQGGHLSLISIIITHHIASRGKFSKAGHAIPLVLALHGMHDLLVNPEAQLLGRWVLSAPAAAI
jgi:hypothetical protein